MKLISKGQAEDIREKRWSRSFRIGNKEFLLGALKEGAVFFEYKAEKGEKIYINRHLIRRLFIDNRLRLVHQSQHKVLKKL
ncbi:hypothetical protein P2W68_04640 [Chryseobacterium arthrosphaerae]|uniref:hypothetical protein n=1 Tax=Chryseobacterium arthrosphaerae TaxID=651561 RepID=UPI0023E32BDC|nr:hypothetical protein [Chryseobacterium arthrosphaerae]WES98902.1 hypothetical protein P2W68_04640 [Chryseobacterium arthrosphaerae]